MVDRKVIHITQIDQGRDECPGDLHMAMFAAIGKMSNLSSKINFVAITIKFCLTFLEPQNRLVNVYLSSKSCTLNCSFN